MDQSIQKNIEFIFLKKKHCRGALSDRKCIQKPQDGVQAQRGQLIHPFVVFWM